MLQDWIPHVVSAAHGSAKIPEAVFHVLVWVVAIVCEGLFQNEYGEVVNAAGIQDSHWSWPIMTGSSLALAIPFASVLIILVLHLFDRVLEKGEIFACVTAIFPTSAMVSVYLMLIQFFNLVLLDLHGPATSVKFGGLPNLLVLLVFLKVYLSHAVTYQIEMGANAKIVSAVTGVDMG